MSQAKTNQNYELDEISEIWESSVGLLNRFRMLLENCEDIQDRVTRCDQVIENTMGDFQGSRRFHKWSLITLVSTWTGIITSRMVVSPIKKTDMFAAGGVLLGTGFAGLVNKCTSYEENAMNTVWRKLRRDLNNLNPLQLNYAEFLKVIKIEMKDYAKLTSDTLRYCISSTNDDNTRMNAHADKILRKTHILQRQSTIIDNLFSDDHNQVHAEQDMFDIQDVFFLQDPSDLINF